MVKQKCALFYQLPGNIKQGLFTAGNTITPTIFRYKLSRFSYKSFGGNRLVILQQMEQAFNIWSSVTNVVFKVNNINHDFEVNFYVGMYL